MSHGSATIAVDSVRRVDSVGGSSTGRPPSSSSYPDHRAQKQNLLLTSDNAKEELQMALQKAQYKLMRAIASVHSSFEELFELSLCCSLGSGLGNNNENTNTRSEEPEVHHQGGLDYFSSIIAQPLAVGSMLTANALKVAKERFQEVEVALAEAELKIEQRSPAVSIQEFAGKQRGMILQQAVALQHDQLACLLENLSSVLRPAGTTPGAAGGHRHRGIFEEKEASQQQAPDPMAGVHSQPSHHPQSNGVHDQSAPWDSTSSAMRDVVTGGGSVGGAPPPFDLHQPRTAGGGFGHPNTVAGPHHQRSGSNNTTAAAATYSKPTNGGGHIPSTVHNRHQHQQQPLATTSSPQYNGNPAGFVDLGSSVFDNSAASHDASGHTPPTPQLHPASVGGASHNLTPPHASPSLIPHNVSTYSAASSSMIGANASNTSYPGGAAPSSSTNHHAGSNGYVNEASAGLHLPPRSAVPATQKTGVAEVTSGSSGSNGNLLARNASQSTGSTASTSGGPSNHPQYHSEESGEDTGGAERSGGSASSSGVTAMANPKPLPHHLGANNSGGGSSKSNRANGNRMT